MVSSFDSFLRAGSVYAGLLEAHGADTSYTLVAARARQISRAQFRAMGFDRPIPTRSVEAIVTRHFLRDFDVVLVALDGLRTRRFMVRFARLWGEGGARERSRPITVSMYPGLIFRFHLEGFMSRMSCDVVALNSPSDARLYSSMLGGLGAEDDNGLCLGLSLLPGRARREAFQVPADGAVVFVAQPTVPSGEMERRYVAEQLVRLARRHPDTRFILKPRHRPTETTLHKVRYHYADLLEQVGGPTPRNLQLSYEPMPEVLDRMRLCLTFSSTAALEAMARGIPTRLLTDIGINENIGNHFFLGSGCLAGFADIAPDMPIALDPRWYEENAHSTEDHAGDLIARIDALRERQRADGRALGVPNERLFGRAVEYNRYLESRAGWAALEQFGAPRLGRLDRIRRLWSPLRRALVIRG